ncbi:MAG: OB-fold nucleic acid binding domain-containing protein, partial [Candidatus Acidiferrales bacterium]
RGIHRRDALWQVERAARPAGPLLDLSEENDERDDPAYATNPDSGAETASPLLPMTVEERLVADFRGTGVTVGPPPMAYYRAELRRLKIRAASELPGLADGTQVRVAGAVIARQRPGTAKGFVFLSLEDETGIANAIITPQLFERDHTVVVHHPFLLIEGKLQNQDNVVSVKAERVAPLEMTRAEPGSHDFH